MDFSDIDVSTPTEEKNFPLKIEDELLETPDFESTTKKSSCYDSSMRKTNQTNDKRSFVQIIDDSLDHVNEYGVAENLQKNSRFIQASYKLSTMINNSNQKQKP